MEEAYLARTVLARWRHARVFSIGDRAAPSSHTPALVGTETDLTELGDVLSIEIAPLLATHDSSSLPASISMRARGAWTPPFGDDDIPIWTAEEGHTLPPSLDDADSGMGQSTGSLLPITWQRLVHDAALNDPDFTPQVIILQDALQLAGHPGRLGEALRIIRERFPGALLWAVGIGGPDNAAILAWFGVDLFDLARSRQASARGLLLTNEGPRNISEDLDESSDLAAQVAEWRSALAATRLAIKQGTLRELVEKQSLNSPRLVEHLRRHDSMLSNSKAPLGQHVDSSQRFRCHSPISREDPLVVDWIRRIRDEYTPAEKQSQVLVLLPCSARKPYSSSQSHRYFRFAIRNRCVHQVMVTSPLGLVPRELECLWPAAHYDVPVTGDWDSDEVETIKNLVKSVVKRAGYSTIVNHSGISLDEAELGIPIVDTRQPDEGASSKAACARLGAAIEAAVETVGVPGISEKHLLALQMASTSRWLHGTDEWMSGLRIGGRPPRWLILEGKQQMAQWHPDSGRFAFAKAVLPRLAETATLRTVEIGGEQPWRGDIFQQMVVSFDPEIRIGEEILIKRGDELLGTARARAAGWEWSGSPGQLAKSQHRL